LAADSVLDPGVLRREQFALWRGFFQAALTGAVVARSEYSADAAVGFALTVADSAYAAAQARFPSEVPPGITPGYVAEGPL
jgi:hypothetical protein